MIEQSRRGFITGLATLIAAPAIIRAGSLMPVKQMFIELDENKFPIVAYYQGYEWCSTGKDQIIYWRKVESSLFFSNTDVLS